MVVRHMIIGNLLVSPVLIPTLLEILFLSDSLIILGAGGHARVLVGELRQQNVEIIAIVAPKIDDIKEFSNIEQLRCDDRVLEFDPNKVKLVNAIGQVPEATSEYYRVEIYRKFLNTGYRFSTVISNSAIVSSYSILEEGVQILPGAIVNSCTVGENTIINSGAIIEHDVCISRHCHIAPGAVVCGGVTIGKNVIIGAGATVIQGITIADNVVVGAGSVVTKNIESNTVHYPARPFIKKRK